MFVGYYSLVDREIEVCGQLFEVGDRAGVDPRRVVPVAGRRVDHRRAPAQSQCRAQTPVPIITQRDDRVAGDPLHLAEHEVGALDGLQREREHRHVKGAGLDLG